MAKVLPHNATKNLKKNWCWNSFSFELARGEKNDVTTVVTSFFLLERCDQGGHISGIGLRARLQITTQPSRAITLSVIPHIFNASTTAWFPRDGEETSDPEAGMTLFAVLTHSAEHNYTGNPEPVVVLSYAIASYLCIFGVMCSQLYNSINLSLSL